MVFTELGVAMLSSVLNSDRAIKVNIEIMRVFTKMRHLIPASEELKQEVEELRKQTDERFQISGQLRRTIGAIPLQKGAK